MTPGLKLEVKQSQQLVMTPQLQQAIRLLQFSHVELEHWLQEACEKNPLLSLEDDLAERNVAAEVEAPQPLDEVAADKPADLTGAMDLSREGEANLFDGPALAEGSRMPGGPVPDGGLESLVADKPGLRAHLHGQVAQMRAGPREKAAAAALIETLDEHGFLREPLDSLARSLGVAECSATVALGLVQACEPTGVGARSLSECLALQLAERDRLDPAMQALLDNLQLVAWGEVARLRRLTGLDAADFSDALAELRTLDPRPCDGFAMRPMQTVVPDVFVRRIAGGGWQVELNPDSQPRLLVDRSYIARIGCRGEEERRFLADCRADASWILKSLDQRQRTILKVATEIVRQQERFLNEGVGGLRPMTLRMVADATGIHESTASRVTANKYMATERGVFELKYFFTNAVGGEGGVAASSVRHRIKAMIEAEPPDGVLSDDTICEVLARDGIDIARRTVAKYRKTLAIPSSVDRRRMKALAAHS